MAKLIIMSKRSLCGNGNQLVWQAIADSNLSLFKTWPHHYHGWKQSLVLTQ